ncbi:hypothetical protein [Aeromonas enteropelogenes]|uniref:hypothetical protein n=1 Tax=Aeromonas enteropelogenes TaxID=29489 RepID=UPI003B9DF822
MHKLKDKKCPILDVKELNAQSYYDSFSSLKEYAFKYEKIVARDGAIIGYEILLNFDKARAYGDHISQYQKSIHDTSATEAAINMLLSDWPVHGARRYFINFERMHLCNKILLKKIALLSKKLHSNNIELVLEITERNVCGFCSQIDDGLEFLNDMEVSLAVDDFDIYSEEDDFRMPEVLSGVYQYIKIEVPLNEVQRRRFHHFSSRTDISARKIIVERIEHKNMIVGLARLFGFQGYAYKN